MVSDSLSLSLSVSVVSLAGSLAALVFLAAAGS
jgi:hypothetical protein